MTMIDNYIVERCCGQKEELHNQPGLFYESRWQFGNFEGLMVVEEPAAMQQELNVLLLLQKQLLSEV